MLKQKGETPNMTPLATLAKAFIDGVMLALSIYLSAKSGGKSN